MQSIMARTLDLGQRIEICSSDPECDLISIGLYRCFENQRPRFLLHTYRQTPAARARVDFLSGALQTMLGMSPCIDDPTWIEFPCGMGHERPLRRSFLDVCKIPSDVAPCPKSPGGFDKKANCNLTMEPLGDGRFRLQPTTSEATASRRAAAVARGYLKLCDLVPGDNDCEVRFKCGTDHPSLLAMLWQRAQNVRAALREDEQTAGRGVLAPPSQQK